MAQLASYDDLGKIQKSAYVLEKGKYQFYLGTSVRETEQVFCFTMPEDTVTEQLTAKLVPTSLAERMLSDGSFEKLPQSNRMIRITPQSNGFRGRKAMDFHRCPRTAGTSDLVTAV